MQILKLAAANLRKKNSSCVSFALLIMLTIMLLDAGIIMLLFIPGYYEKSNERLNAPHYMLRIENNSYEERFVDILKKDPLVKETELREAAMMTTGDMVKEDLRILTVANFYNIDRSYSINPPKLVESTDEVSAQNAIFLPLCFRNRGYKLGDKVQFEYKRMNYTYQVGGFFETTWNGSMATSMYDFYLHEDAYRELYGEIGGGKLLAVRLDRLSDLEEVKDNFKSESGIQLGSFSEGTTSVEMGFDEWYGASTMITNMISGIAVLLSVLLLSISMLVIWFRISNHIQDEMCNIGVLEAIGYTSVQIRASVALEGILNGLAGGIAGILLSYVLLELLGSLVSATLGVVWHNPFHPGSDMISLILVLLIILIVSMMASAGIKRIHPISALRNGMQSHSFKKNHFPLDQNNVGQGRLSLYLAFKAVMKRPRQYIMLGVILIGVTFVLSFAALIYINLGTDSTQIMRYTGDEISDLQVTLTEHADFDKVRGKLEALPGVQRTSVYASDDVKVEGQVVKACVSTDFNELSTVFLYEGDFPQFDNEIVLTGIVAEGLGKRIGDTVNMSQNGVFAEYIICGLTQSINNFGRMCILGLEGLQRVNPSFQPGEIRVYLEEGIDNADYIKELENQFHVLDASGEKTSSQDSLESVKQKAEEKLTNLLSIYGVDSAQYALMADGEIILSGSSFDYEIKSITDMEALLKNSMQTYTGMIAMLSVLLMLLSVLITGLIIQLLVKSTIVRQKQEFGIYKAIGYTSKQLMVQTALAFLPVSIFGIVLGGILGGLLTNTIMGGLLHSMGVSKMEFMIPPLLLPAVGAVLLIYLYFIAYLASGKVKKVSVYALFTD